MVNLIGDAFPRLDDKGRLFLPAKFRAAFVDTGIVLTLGQEGSIFGWPLEVFDRVSAPAREAPFTNQQARAFLRKFYGSASHEIPDKQGRITLSPKHREWAQIDHEVAVVGTGDRIEIWAADRWRAWNDESDDDYRGWDTGAAGSFFGSTSAPT